MQDDQDTPATGPDEGIPAAEPEGAEPETDGGTPLSEIPGLPPELLDPARHKDLQAWATRVAMENAEHRRFQTQAQPQPNQPQAEQWTQEQKAAYVENLIKTKGPGAIVDLMGEIAQEATKPLYSQLLKMKTAMSDPDYTRLEDRINRIYGDVAAGKTNVEEMVLRVAKAEEAMEKAAVKGQPRKPDNAARGTTTGSHRTGAPEAPTLNLNDASMESVARAALKDPTITQAHRDLILQRHPSLRPKE